MRYLWITVVQTLLRVLPFPCRRGLVPIGNPGRDAPVLLTGNFGLTVERVKRAVAGLDAYLLVANSRGINVWCAAAGGHLTNHDVVSILKTSGIESRVDHRRVILPQLAATGVEGREVRKRSGWSVVWGPVYAKDIPAFLSGGMSVSPFMRRVTFPWSQRLEMAVSWAFPISLLALLFLPFWRAGVLPLAGLVWLLSLFIFLAFPLYEKHLDRPGKSKGFVLFDFGRRGLPLVCWAVFLAGLAGGSLAVGAFSWGLMARWSTASLVVLLILSLDLMGSTPTYKSTLHADRLLRIVLDEDRCKGVGACEKVCPTGVFVVDSERRMATLPGADRCVQCGACIVQCPLDALDFRGPDGLLVSPETVRTYKLNLLGSRKGAAR